MGDTVETQRRTRRPFCRECGGEGWVFVEAERPVVERVFDSGLSSVVTRTRWVRSREIVECRCRVA